MSTIRSTFGRSATALRQNSRIIRTTGFPTRTMASNAGELRIENTNIKTAPGVELSTEQKTLVGSVLDLFAGRPSLAKLQLWNDDAVFEDPITIARGREQFAPQWYGLQAVFSEIERLHHEVKSTGNPIAIDMKTRYKMKGIGLEQTVTSEVNIFTNDAGDKITRVQDKWNGSLPNGSFTEVRNPLTLLNPLWWLFYYYAWAWWFWSFTWYTRPWLALRKLNSVTVPKMVSVPKNAEEDAARGN